MTRCKQRNSNTYPWLHRSARTPRAVKTQCEAAGEDNDDWNTRAPQLCQHTDRA